MPWAVSRFGVQIDIVKLLLLVLGGRIDSCGEGRDRDARASPMGVVVGMTIVPACTEAGFAGWILGWGLENVVMDLKGWIYCNRYKRVYLGQKERNGLLESLWVDVSLCKLQVDACQASRRVLTTS